MTDCSSFGFLCSANKEALTVLSSIVKYAGSGRARKILFQYLPGNKDRPTVNCIVINKQAYSLFSLIADGQYRAISLGRNSWKTLIGSQVS